MAKTYIATGFVPGHSTFTEIANVPNSTLAFDTKVTGVKLGEYTEKMTSGTLVLLRPVSVTRICDEQVTCVGEVNESVKIHFNGRYGDTTGVTAMVTEAKRLLDLWLAANASYGVVPNSTPSLDAA